MRTFDALDVVEGKGGEHVDEEAATDDVALRDELRLEDLVAVLVDERGAEVDHDVEQECEDDEHVERNKSRTFRELKISFEQKATEGW